MQKKLYRSRTDKAFSGICAGVAEYFDVDVIIVRLLTVILAFMSFGTVLVIYVIASLVVPEEPSGSMNANFYRPQQETVYQYNENISNPQPSAVNGEAFAAQQSGTGDAAAADDTQSQNAQEAEAPEKPNTAGGTGSHGTASIPNNTPNTYYEPAKEKKSSSAWIIGVLLICFGSYMILDYIFPWISWRLFGAILLIFLGVIVLLKR